jgi:hypothetical protein
VSKLLRSSRCALEILAAEERGADGLEVDGGKEEEEVLVLAVVVVVVVIAGTATAVDTRGALEEASDEIDE